MLYIFYIVAQVFVLYVGVFFERMLLKSSSIHSMHCHIILSSKLMAFPVELLQPHQGLAFKTGVTQGHLSVCWEYPV